VVYVERKVVQQEARVVLELFLIACSEFIPREERTHFRHDFPEKARPEGVAGSYFRSMRKCADAFMRLLQTSLTYPNTPARSDLDILRDALNKPFLQAPGRAGRTLRRTAL
jgi:hypothetical protein